jgi:hypothetical protein
LQNSPISFATSICPSVSLSTHINILHDE